jgi:hypothetical protein
VGVFFGVVCYMDLLMQIMAVLSEAAEESGII